VGRSDEAVEIDFFGLAAAHVGSPGAAMGAALSAACVDTG
jgi:hypothetical protein